MCQMNHGSEAQQFGPHLEAMGESLAAMSEIVGSFKLCCDSAREEYRNLGADLLDGLLRFEGKLSILRENESRARQGEGPLSDSELITHLHTFFPPDVSQHAIRLLLDPIPDPDSPNWQ